VKGVATLKNRKFNWLPVLLLSLLAQYFIQQLLLFIENSVEHSTSWILLIKINFFIVALVGGIVAKHFYIRHSLHIGGICAVLFIVLGQLYIGRTTLNLNSVFVLLLAYLIGYAGAWMYADRMAHKRFR